MAQKKLTADEIEKIGNSGDKENLMALKQIYKNYYDDLKCRRAVIFAISNFLNNNEERVRFYLDVLAKEQNARIIRDVVVRMIGGDKHGIAVGVLYLTGKSFYIRYDVEYTFQSVTPFKDTPELDCYNDIMFEQDWFKSAKTGAERERIKQRAIKAEETIVKVSPKVREKFEKWWEENKDYLYRDDSLLTEFKVDEEAKKNKTPIDPDTRKYATTEQVNKWREIEKQIKDLEPLLMRNLDKAMENKSPRDYLPYSLNSRDALPNSEKPRSE